MPRILRRGVLPPLLVFLQISLIPGAAAADAGERSELAQPGAPSAVLEAFERWLRAIEEHEPGARDAAVATASGWSGPDLGMLLTEGLLPLLRTCDRPVRQRLRTAGGIATPRPRRGGLADHELAFVRRLALGFCRVDDGIVRETPPGIIDHLLRGGAILHGDAAMLALPDPETGAWPPDGSTRDHPPPISSSRMSLLADGTHASVPNTAAAHWAMARILLDQVRADPSDAEPSPGRDAMVRSWYRATLAFMAAVPYADTTHFERAEELFGDDAVVHLLVGSLHEWMASDAVQHVIEAASRPTLMGEPAGRPRISRFPVGSTRAELGRARRHLERAVRLDPSLTEARVRLGRVLGLAGNHRDAAAELRRAVAAAPEPLLAYYANLFLGAEEEALGRLTEAGEAYRRAASLHPDAPTPRLALSHLMRRQGNREDALRLIGEVLAPESARSAPSDPMRRYSRSAGRHVRALLRDMVRLYLEAAPDSRGRAADPVR